MARSKRKSSKQVGEEPSGAHNQVALCFAHFGHCIDCLFFEFELYELYIRARNVYFRTQKEGEGAGGIPSGRNASGIPSGRNASIFRFRLGCGWNHPLCCCQALLDVARIYNEQNTLL